MIPRVPLIRIGSILLVAGLASACGGKTLVGPDDDAEPGEDSGFSATDSGTGTVSREDGGSACVDVEVGSSDLLCGSDQDCALVRTGVVCDGQCSCGSTPVNATAAARDQAEIASLTLESCPCAFPGAPRCLGGQCTLCGLTPGQPAGCADGGTGTTAPDGGDVSSDTGPPDTGTAPTLDAGACVDIDPSTYNSFCNQASDCIQIRSGEVCSGQCACPSDSVNASEQSRYDEAIAGIAFALCGCPDEPVPECIANVCVFRLPP